MVRFVTSFGKRFCRERFSQLFAVEERPGVERPCQIVGAMAAAFKDSLIFPAVSRFNAFVQTEGRHAAISGFKSPDYSSKLEA